jgi:exonuclease III
MNQSSSVRCWNVLCWNIRGLNAESKWESLRNKITESNCDIVTVQETKKSSVDLSFIRNFCPRIFDEFCFLPSVGASGGILVICKSLVFKGVEIFQNNFAISVLFSSLHNDDSWILTSVYGPCDPEGKLAFLDWFGNIHMPDEMDWLIVGDFNLLRKQEDRNRPGGNANEMFLFNEAISSLGVEEIPLHGRKYTWTNKQQPPLLERLDWFFSSAAWSLKYPHTIAKSLIMETSDHWPCIIEIKTSIPKAKVFRFENCWMAHDSFLPLVANTWNRLIPQQDYAMILTAKFKALRGSLRHWQS